MVLNRRTCFVSASERFGRGRVLTVIFGPGCTLEGSMSLLGGGGGPDNGGGLNISSVNSSFTDSRSVAMSRTATGTTRLDGLRHTDSLLSDTRCCGLCVIPSRSGQRLRIRSAS